jgi:hypothetical protein
VAQSFTGFAGCISGRSFCRASVSNVCGDLLELFGDVSDGRSGQGRDHPVAAVLALVAAAVAGMKGYTAITGWVADVPASLLDGDRGCAAHGQGHSEPHPYDLGTAGI